MRISSWARSAPNTFPTLAKTSANYANSQLIKMEAITEGYSEGIALDTFGYVSEGSGQNLFVVRDEIIYTPPLTASILPGITRDSVITIARDLGFKVREEMLPRELLYIADEAFFAGTAVEITPIRSVDKIPVGNGTRGPITTAIQKQFFDIIQRRRARPPRLADVPRPGPVAAGGRARRARAPRATAARTGAMHINDLLHTAVHAGASDLHLKVGSYPMMRVDGTLVVATEAKRLERDDTEAMAQTLFTPELREKFRTAQEVDLAYSVPGLGRFRCNVFQQRGTIGLVLRVIPTAHQDDRRARAAAGAQEDRRRRARPRARHRAPPAAARARRWRR